MNAKSNKLFRRIYYRMLFSYILFVLGITIIISLVAISMSRDAIYGEIGKYTERVLQSTADDILERALVPLQTMRLDLTMRGKELLVIGDGDDYNLRILKIYNTLQGLAARNCRCVDSIHIYYTGKQAMISSNHGYKDFTTREMASQYDWLDMALREQSPFYYTQRSDTATRNMIAWSFAYPHGVSPEKALCVIIFVMDETVLNGLLEKNIDTGYAESFIVDSSGIIVSHSDKSKVFTRLPHNKSEWIESGIGQGARTFTQDGRDYIAVFRRIAGLNWLIANKISVQDFYAPYFSMRINIVGVSALIIVTGVLAGFMFVKHFYSPICKLSEKASGMFFTQDGSFIYKNEYSIIDNAIDQMGLKIRNMQSIFDANAQVMKQNFLLNLLDGAYRQDSQICSRLEIFGLCHEYSSAFCFISDFCICDMDFKQAQAAKLKIIQRLNVSRPEEGWFCIAGELSDIKVMGIVSCEDMECESKAMDYIRKSCGILCPQIAKGSLVPRMAEATESLQTAKTAYRYKFIWPEKPVLDYKSIEVRHLSAFNPAKELCNEVKTIFQGKNPDSAASWVDGTLNELINGEYSIDYVILKSMELARAISEYLSITEELASGASQDKLRYDFAGLISIEYLRDWLKDNIRAAFLYSEKSFMQERIEEIKLYIGKNLNGDLSLEGLSSKFYISPKYLSQTFKEITGGNLSEYIAQRRIEEAKRVISGTRLSIEEISAKVGYNSAAYFIKRFKEATGDTPMKYRRKQALREE